MGFVSNSSSSSFIMAFPKGIERDVICKAKLKLKKPAALNLARATGYDHLDYWIEYMEEFIKEQKVLKETETDIVYEVHIPFDIFRTYEDFIKEVDYWTDGHGEEYYGKHKKLFKNYDFCTLETSNESGDPLNEIIYFIGLNDPIVTHPMLYYVDGR